MGIIEGIFKGAGNVVSNVGRATINIGRFGAKTILGEEAVAGWKVLRKEGAGNLISSIYEFAGKTTIRGAKALGKAASGAAAGAMRGAVPAMTSATGAAAGLAERYASRAVGLAEGTGNLLLKGAFKDDIKNGQIVKDFNNLWTGKKLRPIVGVGLVAGGAALGAYKGISSQDPDSVTGPVSAGEMPAMSYDGNSGSAYNRFANSASGNLTLSLHNLRRG